MDLLILKALANRKRFNSLRSAVPDGMITGETAAMLAWYQAYYDAFPEASEVIPADLASLVKLRSVNADPSAVAITLLLVSKLDEYVSEDRINGMVGQLYELDLSGRAGAIISRYNNGGEVDLAYELNKLAQETVRAKGQATPDTYIDTAIRDLLNEVSDDRGVKFRRFSLLKDAILGLQGGASVAVAARPDKGKTSFIASILTDFAPQCVEFFGADRPILWLCNEGSGKRIIPRIYQAALGLDLNELIALSNAGTLEQKYSKAIGAKSDYIRVKDAHGMSLPQIEQVIEAMRPSMVIYDMLANVRLGKGESSGNKADEIEKLGQGIREMAVIHDHIALSTVQISVDGGNDLYPPYTHLKDSKTALQGAVDIIIMLGSLDNPAAETLRGISTPKNKFGAPGKPSCVRGEVYFDAPRCTFAEGV
jgi:hypothetical protein